METKICAVCKLDKSIEDFNLVYKSSTTQKPAKSFLVCVKKWCGIKTKD